MWSVIQMPVTHVQKQNVSEACAGDLHEKFDASSSQFLAPKQLSGQSRCTVRVTRWTVSVLE